MHRAGSRRSNTSNLNLGLLLLIMYIDPVNGTDTNCGIRFYIITCMGVTVDEFWIDDRVYWTLIQRVSRDRVIIDVAWIGNLICWALLYRA
jgi:hypothetical protein